MLPPSATVLVVDDDQDICALLREALLHAGYEASCTRNGLEALSWLERNPRPTAIVVDLMMPGMNGWTFLEELRAHDALADLPVMIVTAAEAHWGFPVPASRVLRKPFDLDDFLRTLAAITRATS